MITCAIAHVRYFNMQFQLLFIVRTQNREDEHQGQGSLRRSAARRALWSLFPPGRSGHTAIRTTPQCGVYTYCHTHNYSTTPHTGEGPRAQRQVFGLSTVYRLYRPTPHNIALITPHCISFQGFQELFVIISSFTFFSGHLMSSTGSNQFQVCSICMIMLYNIKCFRNQLM